MTFSRFGFLSHRRSGEALFALTILELVECLHLTSQVLVETELVACVGGNLRWNKCA